MFKKTMIYTTCAMIALAGCGGRSANPVMVQQYGDENKSCASLEREMVFTQQEIARLLPDTEKTGKNTALGITGFFLIVPLFFMDLSDAEQQEVNALRQRYNHLASIATDKQCGLQAEQIPPFTQQQTPKEEPASLTCPRHKCR